MTTPHPPTEPDAGPRWITLCEQGIYLAVAVLLAVAAVALLGASSWTFFTDLPHGRVGEAALVMLDRLLLVLMLVELLYTVRVSISAHSPLVPEPFLIVGLIASVRRILVITAEAWEMGEVSAERFERGMVELGILTVMIIAIVLCIILLRRFRPEEADPAGS